LAIIRKEIGKRLFDGHALCRGASVRLPYRYGAFKILKFQFVEVFYVIVMTRVSGSKVT
jgi:hypothetical protein